MDKSIRRRATQIALGIGSVYAAAGVAWILLSDALLLRLSNDARWVTLAQHYKGVGYVLVSAALLAWLVRATNLALLKTQQRLQAGELRAQDLFQHHPQPMWLFDERSLRILAVNRSAITHYGYTKAEFKQMSAADLRPPEDVPQMLAMLRDQTAQHHDAGLVRHRRKDGTLRHVHVSLHRMLIRRRRVVMVVADDVTQEVETREALARQEARFRQLHDSLQEALWLAESDARALLYASPAFEKICGHRPERLLAEAGLWLSLVLPEDLHIAEESLLNLVAFGQAECEYRIRHADGTVRWVADRKRRIVEADGVVKLVGGIIEDISTRKAVAQALRRANERLEARVEARTAELQVVNQELDAFTRTAAHDLKTPLNAIIGFTDLLRRRHGAALGPEGDQMAGHVERSARSMSQLINDLLSLSRVTTHALDLGPIDLGALAREVVDELRHAEPRRQVELHIAEDLVTEADAGLVRALLANLIGNAWKYSGRQPVAVIELGRTDTANGSEFFVRDNGVGFDSSAADKLFKPFQRLHADADFAGSGVGLATCQRIVQRHGGAIRIASVPGQGTTVHFSLAPALVPSSMAAAAV